MRSMSTLRLLFKPTLFTVGVCGTCFCAAAIVQHENHRSHYYSVRRRPPTMVIQDWARRQQQNSDSLYGRYLELRRKVNAWSNQLTTGHKIAFGTIFANFVVLCAWRSKALVPMLDKYFLSQVSTTKIALSPMILSAFSHYTPLHFGFNMFALYSFSNFATSLLGPEQLIGLFISAGTVSSLASITHRLITKRYTASLGASGALLGVIAYICITQPDSSLLIFFIPMAAGTAIKGIMLLDTVGLAARWSLLDHAAHLGGSLFGVWYALYGQKLFYTHKGTIVEKWVKFKGD